jgi:hypothetical protein
MHRREARRQLRVVSALTGIVLEPKSNGARA